MAVEPVVYGASERPPRGDYSRARDDYTCPQNWSAYTEVEHDTWNTLYARQMKILPGRACDAFIRGLDALDLNAGGIPDFDALLNNWEMRSPMKWDPDDPKPVADAITFLLSDYSRAISGEILHVDGGYHAMAAPLR